MPPRRAGHARISSPCRAGAPADAVKSSTPMKCLPCVPSAIPACMSLIIELSGYGTASSAIRRTESVGIALSSALIESHRFLLKGIKNRLWRCGRRGTNDLARGMFVRMTRLAVDNPPTRGEDHSPKVVFTVVKSCEAEKGFSRNRWTPRFTASMALSLEA
jgi:hypothetical protein